MSCILEICLYYKYFYNNFQDQNFTFLKLKVKFLFGEKMLKKEIIPTSFNCLFFTIFHYILKFKWIEISPANKILYQ
jgi:hypothetical protein